MKRSLLLSFVSLLVFLVGAEGAVRLLRPDLSLPSAEHRFHFDQGHQLGVPYHERDDRLGWRLLRGKRVRIAPEGGTGDGIMRINAEGFRGADFDFEKPPGRYRILVAGDSNAMGFPLGDDGATYTAQVEAMLRAYFGDGSRDFEAINMGVDGFTSFQVKRLLADYVPKLRPDLVVVQVGFNDHCYSSRSDASHGFRRPVLLNALERSHAYRFLRRHLLVASGAADRAFEPVPRVSPDEYVENLREIESTCREAGADLLFIATAARPNTPLVINEVKLDEGAGWTTPDRWVEEALRDAGVTTADVGDPRFSAALEELVRRHPDQPLPYYHLQRAAMAARDSTEVIRLREEWRRRDDERIFFRRYVDAMREVAEESGTPVIEVAEVLGRYAATRPEFSAGDFFVDFVHLDARGHALIAQAVGNVVVAKLR